MDKGSASPDTGRARAGRHNRILVPLITAICAGMVLLSLSPVPAIIPAGVTVVLMGTAIGAAWVQYRA